jgi:integrase/recombinase XerD
MSEAFLFSTEEIIKSFARYLQAQGKRPNTVRSESGVIKHFLAWTEGENLDYREVSYTDLMAYINHLKSEGNSKRTINQKLNALSWFYDHLEQKKIITTNPCLDLRLKGIIRRQPHDLLEWETLEYLYQNYPDTGPTGKRNKAMFGMLIYQGLQSGEMAKLETTDLKLESGKVEVPQVGGSNARTLNLESHQILALQKYLMQVRPIILQMSGKSSEKLFISTGNGQQLNNSLSGLMKQVQKLDPRVKSIKQIRASVITHWLKHYNTRQVQYFCGHRYVSSTEHYRTDHLEALQEQIDELHPLK